MKTAPLIRPSRRPRAIQLDYFIMNNPLSNIIICDDHFLTALGAEMIVINNSPYPVTVRKATTGKDALNLFHQKRPDLIIIDLNLPDMPGVDVIKKIRESSSNSKIIVLTGQTEPYVLRQVAQLKINALLRKSDSSLNLSEALNYTRTSREEKIFFDSSVSSILGDDETYVPTKREYEVLELMSQGLTSEKIATRLDCSVATVKTYRSRIMNKSGSRNSAEMIAWFLQRNGKDNFGSNS